MPSQSKEEPIDKLSPTLGADPATPELVRRILRALSGIEYGSVQITIQDSKVIQIERSQKSRFTRPLDIPPPSSL